MSITNMAGRLMTVHRRTALLNDSAPITAAPALVAVDRQAPAGCLVELQVSGAAGFGTLTVNGDVGGVATAEAVAFTGNGVLTTVNRFDAGTLTTIDLAGWGGSGTWTAKAVGSDGSRIHTSYVVASALRCHLNRGGARWPNTVAGVAELESTWLAHDWNTVWAPREGDVYVDSGSGEQWAVVGDPNWLGSLRPHHWEVRVRRNQGSLGT
jgi:hypothetical protein